MPAAEAPRHGSVLSYSHLSYQIPARRGGGTKYIKLVDDVSVEVRPGEMLAIMVSFFLSTSLNSLTLSTGTVRCWYVTSVALTAVALTQPFKR